MRGSKYGEDVQLFKEKPIIDIDLGFSQEELDEMLQFLIHDFKINRHYYMLFRRTDNTCLLYTSPSPRD